MQSHPELRGCVTSCADCGIRFLAHPRNAGRRNLRCPFGCRQRHRRQCSCQRSTAYYRTAVGKAKKKRLNARRQGNQAPLTAQSKPDLCPQGTLPNEPASEPLPASTIELRLEGMVLDESSLATSPMLPYVRMVVSLIEGVEFTCREVVHLLRLAMRQHRIGDPRRAGYAWCFPFQRPP